MSSSPSWRQLFNTVEKAVAPGLQEMTASPGFQDLLAISAKFNANLASEMEKASRQWLHMWNLPAATDVRSLQRQISSLEREVKGLQRSLDAAEAKTEKAPKAKKSSGKGPAKKSSNPLRTVS